MTDAQNGRGRPTKLNSDVQATMVRLLKEGAYFESACDEVGITAPTGYNWLKRGQDELERLEKPRTKPDPDEAPFVDFFYAIKNASAFAEGAYLRKIQHAAAGTLKDAQGNLVAYEGEWQAAAWFLERRYPKRWGKQIIDHRFSGNGGEGEDPPLKLIIEWGEGNDNSGHGD